MPIPKDITKEQLVEFSREHIYYEIRMFFGVLEELEKNPKNMYINNALLEAVIIHANILLDFFYKPQMKPHDAKAIHYIFDVRKWKEEMPSFDKYFRHFYRRRNREVVHLSYKRLEVDPKDRNWDFSEMAGKIRELIRVFLRHADPNLIHPDLHKLIKSGGK